MKNHRGRILYKKINQKTFIVMISSFRGQHPRWIGAVILWTVDSSQVRKYVIPARKHSLLLLTDGEPADNDGRDPQYLRFDTKNGGRPES